MKDLIPLEQFIDSCKLPRARIALVTGSLFGVVFSLLFFSFQPSGSSIGGFVIVGLVSGCLFGISISLLFQSTVLRQSKLVFSGEGMYNTEFDKMGDSYNLRLPGSLKAKKNLAVGGCLYIGNASLYFLPHSINLKQYRSPTVIPLSSSTKIWLELQKPGMISRLLFGKQPPLLVVSTEGLECRFLVPNPDEVFNGVSQVLSATKETLTVKE